MFTSKSSEGQAIGLIPSGVKSKATILVRGLKTSEKTGSRYLDVELTLVGGEYNGRKVWSIIMDPTHGANSDEAKEMGRRQLACILEACGIFKVGDDASYARFEGKTIEDVCRSISGQTIVVKVGIKKGTEGYADKNNISAYLSPNPASRTSEEFKQVLANSGTKNPVNPVGNSGSPFGSPSTPTTPKPNWVADGAAGKSDDVPF